MGARSVKDLQSYAYPYGGLGEWLTRVLRLFPERVDLLVALACCNGPKFEHDELALLASLPLNGTRPIVWLSRAIVLLRAGMSLSEVRRDVEAGLLGQHPGGAALFISVVAREDAPVDTQVADLIAVRELVPSNSDAGRIVVTALRTAIRRRQSGLVDERKWGDLGFMVALRDVMREPPQ